MIPSASLRCWWMQVPGRFCAKNRATYPISIAEFYLPNFICPSLFTQDPVDLRNCFFGVFRELSFGLGFQIFLIVEPRGIEPLHALQRLSKPEPDERIIRGEAKGFFKAFTSTIKIIAGQVGFADVNVVRRELRWIGAGVGGIANGNMRIHAL